MVVACAWLFPGKGQVSTPSFLGVGTHLHPSSPVGPGLEGGWGAQSLDKAGPHWMGELESGVQAIGVAKQCQRVSRSKGNDFREAWLS